MMTMTTGMNPLLRWAMIGALALSAAGLSGCASMAGAGSEYGEAKQEIQKKPAPEAVRHPKTDNASALRLARMLVAQQRLEGALGVYAELDRKGGMDAKTLLEYAGVASLVEPPRRTLTLFMRAEAAVKHEGAELTPEEEGELYTGLGRAYMASARSDDALAALERAVKAAPRNVAAQNALGVLLESRGEHEKAVAALEKALEISPANPQVLNNLALAYLGAGDAKRAMKTFADAESFLPDSASGPALSIRLNRAFAQFMTGSIDRARETLSQFMAPEQTSEMLDAFGGMKSRIDAGESTLADECLRAAQKLVQIRPKAAEEGYGYEVPAVITLAPEEAASTGLSPRAKTIPVEAAPEAVKALIRNGESVSQGEKAVPASASSGESAGGTPDKSSSGANR